MTDNPSTSDPDHTQPGGEIPGRPDADAVDLVASGLLDAEPSIGDDDPVPDAADVDPLQLERRMAQFEAVAAALRDEPVAVDPRRREDTIAAVLAVSSTVGTPDDGPPNAPVVDELATRRSMAAVPAPARRTPRFARSGLVAAALLLVAAIGLVATNIAGNSSFQDSSSEDAGSAAMDAQTTTPADSGGDDLTGGATDERTTEGFDQAPAAGEAAPPSTTIPQTLSSEVIVLGTYGSIDELLSAMVAQPPPAATQTDNPTDATLSCVDGRAVNSLVVVGNAMIAAQSVLVASDPITTEIVVFDAQSCTELGRRAA